MRIGSLALLSACAVLLTPALAEEGSKARPDLLARPIRAGVTYEGYLQQVMGGPRQAFGTKGFLEKADIDRQQQRSLAQARAAGVMAYLAFDGNGDGRVTAEEIKQSLSQPGERVGFLGTAGAATAIERRLADLMKADTNGDGVVDYDEMRAAAEVLNRGNRREATVQSPLAAYLALAPDGKLTAPGLLGLARETFEAADTDHDTVISEEEAKAFAPLQAMPQPMRGGPGPREEACRLPPVIPGSKLVLYGTGGGTRQATVSLAGDEGDVTHVADVRIEPGEEPLYLVLTSYDSMLWRFSGDVDRVVRVVATATRRADNSGAGQGGSGVAGIKKERVSFLASWNCLREFRTLGGIDEAKARGILSELVGRQPDVKGAAPTTGTLSIPSMKVEADRSQPGWQPLPVVDVAPEGVVAAVPVKRFDVLPGQPGLDQLVERGNLQKLSQGGGYKIVRTFPRFPTGLTGGIQPSFLLGQGVEIPGGSPGWACVISEETGKPVGNPSPMCR